MRGANRRLYLADEFISHGHVCFLLFDLGLFLA
jgi:hypothetical protein